MGLSNSWARLYFKCTCFLLDLSFLFLSMCAYTWKVCECLVSKVGHSSKVVFFFFAFLFFFHWLQCGVKCSSLFLKMSYLLLRHRMLYILVLMFFLFLLRAAASLLWRYALALACHSCCFTCCLLNDTIRWIERVIIRLRFFSTLALRRHCHHLLLRFSWTVLYVKGAHI